MEKEGDDDGRQVDASEVWDQLDEERRERILNILTRVAYRYAKSRQEGGEHDRAPESSDRED